MFLLRGRRSAARRDRLNFARFFHAPRARSSGAATAATAVLPRLGVGGILRQTASSAAGAEAAWWVSAGRASADFYRASSGSRPRWPFLAALVRCRHADVSRVFGNRGAARKIRRRRAAGEGVPMNGGPIFTRIVSRSFLTKGSPQVTSLPIVEMILLVSPVDCRPEPSDMTRASAQLAARRDTTNPPRSPRKRSIYWARRTPPEGLTTPRRDCRVSAAL